MDQQQNVVSTYKEKRKEILTHAAVWMSREDIMPSGISQLSKEVSRGSTYTRPWSSQIHGETTEGQRRSYGLMGAEF